MNEKNWLFAYVKEGKKEILLKVLTAILCAVISICILAPKIPETKLIKETIESLEESNETVLKFSGATTAASLAISAFPDDFGSPLAEQLAGLNAYFIFMCAIIFLEKLIVIVGPGIAFKGIIPVACALFVLEIITKKSVFKTFAIKVAILGLAIVFVIPVSVKFTESTCADYMNYVDETIAEANAGAQKVNEVSETGEEGIFEKMTNVFKTAIEGVNDLVDYFKNILKKCMNSIAIMLVTTFVVPLMVLCIFRWLLKELFDIKIPETKKVVHGMKKSITKKNRDGEEDILMIGEEQVCEKEY